MLASSEGSAPKAASSIPISRIAISSNVFTWCDKKPRSARERENNLYEPAGAPTPDEFVTVTDFDDLGVAILSRNPELEETTLVANPAGEITSITDPLGETSTTSYDVGGRVVRVTDPLGRYSENTYDLAGRLTDARRYSPTDVLLTHESSEYDGVGNWWGLLVPGVTKPGRWWLISPPCWITTRSGG